MNDVIANLSSYWTIERCKLNCSILITGLKPSCAIKPFLAGYFSTTLKEIEMLPNNSAKVTVKDHSGVTISLYLHLSFVSTVIPRVMTAVNRKTLGPNVRAKECSVFDSLSISSDEEREPPVSFDSLLKKLWGNT